jgi:hypothetical protein
MANYVGKRKECNVIDDYMNFNFINLCKGKYRIKIPKVGICCNAYFESKRIDGKYWTHYPLCDVENCPILFPKLLEGAKFKI